MLNNLVESNVGSNRDTIEADLLEKIVYDDPVVFKRLRVDQVDSNFVASIRKVGHNLNVLKRT